MRYPIINNKETFRGVDFYLDSDSFKNWFVAPGNNPWIHSTPASVGGRTILNARKEYIVDSELINEFSKSKGGISTTPISLKGYNNQLEFNFPYSSEHEIKLDVLDSLPYPSLIFSATLLNTASDFSIVLQEITNKIKSDTLLKGILGMSFQGIEIINKTSVVYNLKKVLIRLTETLSGKGTTKSKFYKELYELVYSNFSAFANSEFTALTSIEKDELIDYLCNLFSKTFISNEIDVLCFDGKATFQKILLRDQLELEDRDFKSIYFNTILETHSLTF